MTNIALLIIYNHRYDKNIPKLNDIYRHRFRNIYHVVPFYDGEMENVIAVYEHSWFFQGYVSQAYQHLKDKGFTHFFAVADDMLLNPELNENNLFEYWGLGENECFLDYFHFLPELKWRWYQLRAMKWKLNQRGVEVRNILPTKQKALEQFKKHGIPYSNIPVTPFLSWHVEYLYTYLRNYKRRLTDYPLVGGYADIFLVTSEVMEKFALYCGAFSATKLFVELAIPTALVLSSDNIKLSKDLNLSSGALWSEKDKEFLKRYNNSLDGLMENFPKDKLFLHPIKLSQWK